MSTHWIDHMTKKEENSAETAEVVQDHVLELVEMGRFGPRTRISGTTSEEIAKNLNEFFERTRGNARNC